MKIGLRGNYLPESWSDYWDLYQNGHLRYKHCMLCSSQFGIDNVHTAAGWAETQISGTCEECWDELFADEEEDLPF